MKIYIMKSDWIVQDFFKYLVRLSCILFLFGYNINFLLIFFVIIQNSLTQNNILNIYSSGLFFDYNQTKKVTQQITILLILYFFIEQISSF